MKYNLQQPAWGWNCEAKDAVSWILRNLAFYQSWNMHFYIYIPSWHKISVIPDFATGYTDIDIECR